MDIPALPTDNLYKFMAISGVLIAMFFSLILIYSMYIIETKNLEIDNNINNIDINIEIFKKSSEIETNYINDLVENLKQKSELAKTIYKNLNTRELIKDYNEYLKDKEKINEMIYKVKLKLEDNNNKLKFEIQKNKSFLEELKKMANFFIILSIICFLGIILGIYLAIKGFSLWKTRLQDYLDKNIKKINSNEISYKKRNNYR